MAYEKKSYKEINENRKKSLDDITRKLEDGITACLNSDTYRDYLKCMSKFHSYSFNNTMLIATQRPDATMVGGMNTWNKLGRRVKKNSRSIKILAPAPFKKKVMQDMTDSNGALLLGKDGKPLQQESEIVVPAFKVVSVFDYADTEGKELPSLGVDELKGSIDKYADLMDALVHVAPVPVEFKDIESGAKGYFSPSEQKICIQEGMSEMQTVKTLLHETGHALVHDAEHSRVDGIDNTEKKNRAVKELEAESIAFVCATNFDIDVSDYTMGYISGWTGEHSIETLKESLNTIKTASHHIIEAVENYLEEKYRDREELVAMAKRDEQLNAELHEADLDALEVKAEAKKDTAIANAVATEAAVITGEVIKEGVTVAEKGSDLVPFKEQLEAAKAELAKTAPNKTENTIKHKKDRVGQEV